MKCIHHFLSMVLITEVCIRSINFCTEVSRELLTFLLAMNETEPRVSIRQRATISLMWVLCQFTSHRLDLGHHHLYYNKLIYNKYREKYFLF